MHYYQHHIGDFIKDTSYLTNEEVGIYMKLLWLYYDTEKPLINNLYLLSIKVNARENESIVHNILEMFFIEQEDGWHHSRCDEEIAEYNQYCAKQKANGIKGGRPKSSENNPLDNPPLTQIKPKITLTTNHKPLTTNHSKNIAPPDGVDISIWNDFLTLRKAKKLPVTQTAINGLIKEGKKANMNLLEVLKTCCERGWGGFKADWVKDKQTAHDRNMQTLSALTGGIHGNDFSFKSIKDHTIDSITTIDELQNDKLL